MGTVDALAVVIHDVTSMLMSSPSPESVEALRQALQTLQRLGNSDQRASGQNDHPRAAIQQGPGIHNYVLPMMVARVMRTQSEPLGWRPQVDSVEGTGFLLANGRGLGITARHVAVEMQKAAPTLAGELPSPVPSETEIILATAGFIQPDGRVLGQPIMAWDLHPTEDLALFRLPDDNYWSQYTIHPEKQFGATEYDLWGYPDDVRHELFSEGNRTLSVPLIYSGGYIRRAYSHELAINDVRGRNFYELNTPAGSCASGSAVSLKWNPGRVIGVYVGERQNETGTFSAGYATTSQVIATKWPALVGDGDMSELCPIPKRT
jgi:hypothetical protein